MVVTADEALVRLAGGGEGVGGAREGGNGADERGHLQGGIALDRQPSTLYQSPLPRALGP